MRIDCLVQNRRVVSLYFEPIEPSPVAVRVKDRFEFSIDDDLNKFERFDFKFDSYVEVGNLVEDILKGRYEKKQI